MANLTKKQTATVVKAIAALEAYCASAKSLADSGDCGYWDETEQPEYVNSQTAIAELNEMIGVDGVTE